MNGFVAWIVGRDQRSAVDDTAADPYRREGGVLTGGGPGVNARPFHRTVGASQLRLTISSRFFLNASRHSVAVADMLSGFLGLRGRR